jgi:hypothetical protein
VAADEFADLCGRIGARFNSGSHTADIATHDGGD